MTTQVDEEAKAMIAAYMSAAANASAAYDDLLERAKGDPEEYIESLICLAIEMLRRLSAQDKGRRPPDELLEEIGLNLAH